MVGKIRFRPLGRKDIETNSSGEVAFSHKKSNHNALEFGENYDKYTLGEVDKSTLNMLKDNVRNHITLPFRVVNKVLAGGNLEVIKSITGLTEVHKLLTFEKILDTSDNQLIEFTADIGNKEIDVHNSQYKVGAEAVYHLIETTSMEHLIKTYILDKVVRYALINVGIKIKMDDEVPGEVTFGKTSSNAVHIAKEWHYNPEYIDATVLTQEAIYDVLKIEYNRQRSTLSYLVNMYPNKEPLLGMFIQQVIVPPSGLHPTIDGRVDAFVKKYAKLLDQVNSISSIFRGSNTMRISNYISLTSVVQSRVDRIMFKSDPRDDKDFSYAEKLKGKFGYIRSKMLGKRSDYSARAIITINAELSVDHCKLPAKIIADVYKMHHIKALKDVKTIADINKMSAEEAAQEIKALGILDRIPCHLNRAPSLHLLSYLALYADIGVSDAIEISPLVTTGFNADFDGDSMGVHVPLSEAAIAESINLMLPSRNIRHPASGKPILVPKMEMVLGLNRATLRYPDGVGERHNISDIQDIVSKVRTHKIKVYDFVFVQGQWITAGRAAFNSYVPPELALRPYDETPEEDFNNVITSKNIMNIMMHILDNYSTEKYRQVVDDLVDFGFKMAKIYTPTISVLDEYEDPLMLDPAGDFNESMKKTFELYQVGLEEEERYLDLYTEKVEELNKAIKRTLAEVLGPDNGFLQLVNAGARGSESNLVQIHWMKGLIQKSDHESFAAIIDRGYVDQLFPLQHFISAYGSRKGLTDRTRKTGDTGYLGRLLFHASSDYVITNKDCHTDKGFKVSKGALLKFIKDDDEAERNARVSEVFAKCITNRVDAQTRQIITPQMADKLANDPNVQVISIRSPITCENPCCQVCYGYLALTTDFPAIGMAIGYIAGQAIGEPGTQLTMRTFQKGGVAGKKDVTSNFDRIDKFIKLGNFDTMNTYDPVAWADGEIEIRSQNARTKVIGIKGYAHPTRIIDVDAELKQVVERGESMSIIPGDSPIKELLMYSDFESTQQYLLNALYTCYLGQAEINLIHFEILVASMTVYGVLDTNSPDMLVGQLYTAQRLHEEINKGYYVNYFPTIKSVKQLPILKDSPLSNIVLEDVIRGFTKATLLGIEDRLDTSMGRLLIGLKPKLGTELNPDFLNRP